MDISELGVGDYAVRCLSNGPWMLMIVTKVEDEIIYCDAIEKDGKNIFHGDWTFDRKTGAEEDEDLGWGVKHNRTGTYLILPYSKLEWRTNEQRIH